MKTGLISTCKEIVALEDFNIEMKRFEGENDCGTCYCVAGRLAMLDGHPEKYYRQFAFDYVEYSYNKLEASYDSRTEDDVRLWYFLFSEQWSDSLKDAKERAQYVIDNGGSIPKHWNYLWNYI